MHNNHSGKKFFKKSGLEQIRLWYSFFGIYQLLYRRMLTLTHFCLYRKTRCCTGSVAATVALAFLVSSSLISNKLPWCNGSS